MPDSKTPSSALNALVAYGTARGSTGWIGEAIAEGLESTGMEASAVKFDLVDMMPGRVESADIFGLGAPVYFLREPAYVADFVAELPSLEGKKAFVFCTCGMDRVGETLARLRDLLVGRGAEVVGAEYFQSSMSYLPYRRRGLGNAPDLPDRAQFDAARAFGSAMARALELEGIAVERVSRATRWKAQLLASRRFRSVVFPAVYLDTSKCTGYGSCISRCAFLGLDRGEDEEIPSITDRCIQCLECVDTCPREALVVPPSTREWLSTLSYRLGIH